MKNKDVFLLSSSFKMIHLLNYVMFYKLSYVKPSRITRKMRYKMRRNQRLKPEDKITKSVSRKSVSRNSNQLLIPKSLRTVNAYVHNPLV